MARQGKQQTGKPGGKPEGRGGRGGDSQGRGGESGQGGQGGRGERGEGKPRRPRREEEAREELDERVIDITRVAKVVKGGRHFAFRTVVVVGDNKGNVGLGIGKSRAVPDSIRKATERARRNMVKVSLSGNTIPHMVVGEHGGAEVLLKPATPGTGVIAGGGVRAVLEAAGVRNILSKSMGSNNVLNVAFATFEGLRQLNNSEKLAAMRGKEAHEVRPFWEKKEKQNG